MNLIDNKALLFHDEILPNVSLYEKYVMVKQMPYVLLNNVNIFGPFPEPQTLWDISEEEKIAIYNPEVAKVLTWIRTRIITNLAILDYKTLHVLMRIATGMLNKCDIPKEIQIMFHDNMVDNLNVEVNKIILSQLPFLD